MRPLAAVLLLGLLAGCGGQTVSASGGGGACAAVLRWNGTLYMGTRVHGHQLERTRRLGRGTEPGCSDTGGNGSTNPSSSQSRTVWRIRGIAPRLAVTVAGEGDVAYVSPSCHGVRRCRRLLGG